MSNVGQPQRRTLLTGGLATSAALLVGCSSQTGSAAVEKTAAAKATTAPPPARPDSPRAAFARLREGNKRWVTAALQHPNQDDRRRRAVAEEQKPYGVVVSCIDSRVPPEIVFDTGLGDLFVIRTGGHVVGPVVTGSAEYGPVKEGTPLIVVLGHQRCGAVTAAYEAIRDGKELPGNLQAVAEALRPAYEAATKEKSDDPVDTMIRKHTELTTAGLRSDKSLAPLVKKGKLAVVGAYYSLDSGRMKVLTDAPSA